MKFLFDFFPLLAFFISFKVAADPNSAIYIATTVLIIASVIQITLYWLLYKRFEKMHLITFAVLCVFGGATLLLHDEKFLQWKPTVVFWIFALVTLASQYIGKKNMFQRMVQYSDENINVPDIIWFQLNISLILFFILVSVLNLYVAYNFDIETWINFKVFGVTGLMMLFLTIAILYLYKHAAPLENILADTEDQHKLKQE